MTTRSDSALASLLLTNRLVEVGTNPLSAGEYWPLVEQVRDPAVLLGATADSLVGDFGVRRDLAERAVRLLDAGTALALELERLDQQGVAAISPFDGAYPDRLRRRLGAAAPPVLYAAGPTTLLDAPGVAVVGARDVGDDGAMVARRVARLVAGRGDVLVSGGAKGVDQVAMNAASQAGGAVVGVLADALARRLGKPDTRRAVSRGQACLLTPYKPTAGFSVAGAMARNKIVYALSRVTLVVAADAGKGGTWEGAVEALRRGFGPVAVWTGAGAGEGNALLAQRGARPVDEPEGVLDEPDQPPAQAAGQLRLGV